MNTIVTLVASQGNKAKMGECDKYQCLISMVAKLSLYMVIGNCNHYDADNARVLIRITMTLGKTHEEPKQFLGSFELCACIVEMAMNSSCL